MPVVWVGLPAIRGPRSTGDMSYLDELFRARAEKAGITYVDVWDGFVDENGRYAVQGPDFEGQTRRLRSGDGIHFTKAGAVKLAHYVEHELRRLMSNHVVPVALPAPEQQGPQNGAPAKSAIGPVLPLTAALGAEGGDLLGAGSRADPPKADPIVLRVLSHGDAIAAPAGRADDFSWPRGEFGTKSANASAERPPAPTAAHSDQKPSDQKKPPEPQPQTATAVPEPAPATVQPPPTLIAPPKADEVKKPEPRRQSRGQGPGQERAQGAAQADPGAAPAAPPQKQRRTRTTQENVPRPPLSIGGWRPNSW